MDVKPSPVLFVSHKPAIPKEKKSPLTTTTEMILQDGDLLLTQAVKKSNHLG